MEVNEILLELLTALNNDIHTPFPVTLENCSKQFPLKKYSLREFYSDDWKTGLWHHGDYGILSPLYFGAGLGVEERKDCCFD